MTDTLDDVAERAGKEWDCREVESQFDLPAQSVSIPCQLTFTESPERRVQKFHDALNVHGFTPLASDPTKGYESPHYDGEICSKDHYNRIRILVFRSDVIRIYPHDGYVPTDEELAKILHALRVGFRADLEHTPIDDDP